MFAVRSPCSAGYLRMTWLARVDTAVRLGQRGPIGASLGAGTPAHARSAARSSATSPPCRAGAAPRGPPPVGGVRGDGRGGSAGAGVARSQGEVLRRTLMIVLRRQHGTRVVPHQHDHRGVVVKPGVTAADEEPAERGGRARRRPREAGDEAEGHEPGAQRHHPPGYRGPRVTGSPPPPRQTRTPVTTGEHRPAVPIASGDARSCTGARRPARRTRAANLGASTRIAALRRPAGFCTDSSRRFTG